MSTRKVKQPGEQADRGPAGLLRIEALEAGRVVVVGLGGIGSILAAHLLLFLASIEGARVRVVLADGDEFEVRNRERAWFPRLGNKAIVLCESLSRRFGRPGLSIRPVDRFVTEENAADLIRERDIVLACVDNHRARKTLSDRVASLRDALLISGGNDGVENGLRGTYGNVQVYERRRGVDRNPSLTLLHPEIERPAEPPGGPAASCAAIAASAPQLLFANLAAASAMLNAFYRFLRADEKAPMYDEVCFDILEAQVLPHWHAAKRSTVGAVPSPGAPRSRPPRERSSVGPVPRPGAPRSKETPRRGRGLQKTRSREGQGPSPPVRSR
jgi:molybdopterin/thiamine biosynthesis adenylyltransferase